MYRKDERSATAREPTLLQRRKTSSFSSSLLDAICHSITQEEEQETTMLKKITHCTPKWENFSSLHELENDVTNLGHAIMVENWVERQSTTHSSTHSPMHVSTTSWSSSEYSSYGYMFSSSSDEHSSFKDKSRIGSSFTTKRQKPVVSEKYVHSEHLQKQHKPKNGDGGFTKTKLKALKIYSELKKVKQPISPGGRISTFLNSIFNSNNTKKAKMCYVGAVEDVSLECKSKSACSSASSFSRSCLSKTPNSRGKLSSNGTKRSVRFCPVSVIVDEDCRPCGQKCIYEEDPTLLPSLHVQNVGTKSSLKQEHQSHNIMENGSYQKKASGEIALRGLLEDEDQEEDDADSYASSDLFEIDSLIGIGNGRYSKELPVYETTNLKTNQAIANGLIL